MNNTTIKAEIVAHSINPQEDELISVLCTFPRIILAEVNTHRMLSKNTSSSRAIPFKKMVESIKNDPFIPIAWQKVHSGMQGTEYITDEDMIEFRESQWLEARDAAINHAERLNNPVYNFDFNVPEDEDREGVTKQLCNRLLEPFMWTTMLITGSREGWENFFHLRNPSYQFHEDEPIFKSKKDFLNYYNSRGDKAFRKDFNDYNYFDWAEINKGQAEIHIMDLAEKIWDAVNESTPKHLEAGRWHIPFLENLNLDWIDKFEEEWDYNENDIPAAVRISTAMAARTSYTVVGDEKEIDFEKMIALHDRLLSQDPPHSSPLEHCARAMNDDEYKQFWKSLGHVKYKDKKDLIKVEGGWCNNLKGFIPYRYIVDNNYN